MFYDGNDERTWKVLVNHEEQYSLWPAEKEIPAGWRDTGQNGSKEACLQFVREVWTDMRPLSLRKAMDSTA